MCETKFRPDISIHGWSITTFGWWKTAAAILEFYLWFQFSHLQHHRRAVMHRTSKFRPNRTICGRVMTSYMFSTWHRNSTFAFVFCDFVHFESSKSTCTAYQISAIYPNPLVRHYYFRLLKTNVRHVGILLSVSIFIFASSSICHSALAY